MNIKTFTLIFQFTLIVVLLYKYWTVNSEVITVNTGHQIYSHVYNPNSDVNTEFQPIRKVVEAPTTKQAKVATTKRAKVPEASSPYKHRRGKLSPKVIKGIKKFVYFVGYHRSGHSIVGSLLDAHPHVVIAHEYLVSNHFPDLNKAPNERWKDNLFNTLYRKSVYDIALRQQNHAKGYSLAVPGLWQGEFHGHIEAIGDKSGSRVTLDYLDNKEKFMRNYLLMKERIAIPIRILHVVRNPFDMISTETIIEIIGNEGLGRIKQIAALINNRATVNPPGRMLKEAIDSMFREFDAVTEITKEVFGKENVLEIHNSDLVDDPRGVLLKIFQFLEVDTTEHFLRVCAEKVFKSVSRSRDLMVWPPEQREWVEERMKNYKMLSRYNFTSD